MASSDPHPLRCVNCPLIAQQFVPASGASPCSVMVVGTAPSETEERTGEPFTGKTSEVVREIMQGLGLAEQVLYTNLIPRRPVGPGGVNRKPTAHELDYCSGHLVQTIQSAKPDLIVAVGASPAAFIVGQKLPSLALVHGLVMKVDRFGMYMSVMPVHDPAYLARRGGLLSSEGQAWIEDLQSIRDVLEDGLG